MGQPLGTGPAGLAHRVLGHEPALPGPGFDIHGGGRDLIFPHHENEIAQAEGALHEPFVRFWMHNGMLNLRDEKMSKSVGNIFLLREALKQYRPEVLIMYFVSSHYRSPMEFSGDLLDEAGQQVERLRNVFRALGRRPARRGTQAPRRRWRRWSPPGRDDIRLQSQVSARRRGFDDALADDLNTAAALGEVFALVREVNSAARPGDQSRSRRPREIRLALAAMVHVLGLDAVSRADAADPGRRGRHGRGRRQAPAAARDFAEADRLRDAILERGYEVRDAAEGYQARARLSAASAAAPAAETSMARRDRRRSVARLPTPPRAGAARRPPADAPPAMAAGPGPGSGTRSTAGQPGPRPTVAGRPPEREVIYGRNPVREALRGRRRVFQVWLAPEARRRRRRRGPGRGGRPRAALTRRRCVSPPRRRSLERVGPAAPTIRASSPKSTPSRTSTPSTCWHEPT